MIDKKDGSNPNVPKILAIAINGVELAMDAAMLGIRLQHTLVQASNFDVFLDLAKRVSTQNAGKGMESLLKIERESRALELTAWSNSVITADYDPINKFLVLALWSVIETTIEDVAIESIREQKLQIDSIQIPKHVFVKLERKALNSNFGIFAYIELLGNLNIEMTIDESYLKSLNELKYIRNCLLHRGGEIDDRVIRAAPGSTFNPGETISITLDKFSIYLSAAGKFLLALQNAVYEYTRKHPR
jgi:hypothetical protein